MINNYVAADVIEIGEGHNTICGETKGILYDDCPNQDKRTVIIEEERD
jgi:hypothetical protein